MGFFSGVSKALGAASGLFGGPEQEKQVAASGFYTMPKEYRDAYIDFVSRLGNTFEGGGADMFTPLGINPGEQNALERAYAGVTPTAETLGADIAMQMNPYDDYVINEINNQAEGEYSILKSALNEAGQFGSNRQMLGANDIDQRRLDQIGRFKQGQFNRAVDNSLNALTRYRAGDIGLAMNAGGFERGLDLQTKQAPVNALNAFGALLGATPRQFGNQREGGTIESGSSAGGFLGKAGKVASIAGSIASIFPSDRRLKDTVEKVDEHDGVNIYEFKYIGSDNVYRGVMADEIKEKYPDAVSEVDGFMAVDYLQLPEELQLQEVTDGVS